MNLSLIIIVISGSLYPFVKWTGDHNNDDEVSAESEYSGTSSHHTILDTSETERLTK